MGYCLRLVLTVRSSVQSSNTQSVYRLTDQAVQESGCQLDASATCKVQPNNPTTHLAESSRPDYIRYVVLVERAGHPLFGLVPLAP